MIAVHDLPYLTHDIAGVGGHIKARPGDFAVEEVPLYPASGSGTHVYFKIEKTGLTTFQAVQEIARALGRPVREFGYAGLKDADAVTVQTLSLEHIDPQRIEALQVPRLRVLHVTRHGNKLKLGHLAGNRFQIKLRGVGSLVLPTVRQIMEVLERRGVPNYFGPQRFGSRGDTWQIGRAVLTGDFGEALAVMLGRPGASDYGTVREARELFDQSRYADAAHAWKYPFRAERTVCHALAKEKGNVRRAFRAVDLRLVRLYVSAYQSHLFNQVLAQRVAGLDRLMTGDLAWKHDNGAVFAVEDAAVEQPRCDAFEISPTGPIFGSRMTWPKGEPAEMERALIEGEQMEPDQWREGNKGRVSGGRRALRFQPMEASVESGSDEGGNFIELRFTLKSGCYATAVLREISKAAEPILPEGDE